MAKLSMIHKEFNFLKLKQYIPIHVHPSSPLAFTFISSNTVCHSVCLPAYLSAPLKPSAPPPQKLFLCEHVFKFYHLLMFVLHFSHPMKLVETIIINQSQTFFLFYHFYVRYYNVIMEQKPTPSMTPPTMSLEAEIILDPPNLYISLYYWS